MIVIVLFCSNSGGIKVTFTGTNLNDSRFTANDVVRRCKLMR